MLGQVRHGSPGFDLGSSGGLFSDAARPCQRPAPPFGANVALSKIEIRDQNRKGGLFSPSSASLVTPTPAKPRQPRRKSHPSLQCHNLQDWVADGEVWSYPVSLESVKTGH